MPRGKRTRKNEDEEEAAAAAKPRKMTRGTSLRFFVLSRGEGIFFLSRDDHEMLVLPAEEMFSKNAQGFHVFLRGHKTQWTDISERLSRDVFSNALEDLQLRSSTAETFSVAEQTLLQKERRSQEKSKRAEHEKFSQAQATAATAAMEAQRSKAASTALIEAEAAEARAKVALIEAETAKARAKAAFIEAETAEARAKTAFIEAEARAKTAFIEAEARAKAAPIEAEALLDEAKARAIRARALIADAEKEAEAMIENRKTEAARALEARNKAETDAARALEARNKAETDAARALEARNKAETDAARALEARNKAETDAARALEARNKARKEAAEAEIKAKAAEEAAKRAKRGFAPEGVLADEPAVIPVAHEDDKEPWQSSLRGLLGSGFADCTFRIAKKTPQELELLGIADEARFDKVKETKRGGRFAMIVAAEREATVVCFFFIKVEPDLVNGLLELSKNRVVQKTRAAPMFLAPLGQFVSHLTRSADEEPHSFLVFPWVRSIDLGSFKEDGPIQMCDKDWLIGCYNLTAALHWLDQHQQAQMKDADMHAGQVLVTEDRRLLFIDLGLAQVTVVQSDGITLSFPGSHLSQTTSQTGLFSQRIVAEIAKHIVDKGLRDRCIATMYEAEFYDRARALKSLIVDTFPDVAEPEDTNFIL